MTDVNRALATHAIMQRQQQLMARHCYDTTVNNVDHCAVEFFFFFLNSEAHSLELLKIPCFIRMVCFMPLADERGVCR